MSTTERPQLANEVRRLKRQGVTLFASGLITSLWPLPVVLVAVRLPDPVWLCVPAGVATALTLFLVFGGLARFDAAQDIEVGLHPGIIDPWGWN